MYFHREVFFTKWIVQNPTEPGRGSIWADAERGVQDINATHRLLGVRSKTGFRFVRLGIGLRLIVFGFSPCFASQPFSQSPFSLSHLPCFSFYVHFITPLVVMCPRIFYAADTRLFG